MNYENILHELIEKKIVFLSDVKHPTESKNQKHFAQSHFQWVRGDLEVFLHWSKAFKQKSTVDHLPKS